MLEVGLGSNVWSYRELREYAHQFEKKLLEVPGVAQVNSTGYREREIHIDVSPDALVKYGITMNQIIVSITIYVR